MNMLLIFFALPVATIIISIILEKVIRNPITVSALVFAIYLIVTFTAFDTTFLVYTIAYTLLAYSAAVIACIVKRLGHNSSFNENNNNVTRRNTLNADNLGNIPIINLGKNNGTNGNVQTSKCGCANANTDINQNRVFANTNNDVIYTWKRRR